jgi:hypothetical protein
VKTAILVSFALGLGASAARAQVTVQRPVEVVVAPFIAESRAAYEQVKSYLTAAAGSMPATGYAFKAAPGVRTFGALLAHVADEQMRACSVLNGQSKTIPAASKTGKAALTAALAQSFTECDRAWGAVNGVNAFETYVANDAQRTRLGSLISNTAHGNEEYGYMAVYLRLKGIVPPSSEGAAKRGIAPPGR